MTVASALAEEKAEASARPEIGFVRKLLLLLREQDSREMSLHRYLAQYAHKVGWRHPSGTIQRSREDAVLGLSAEGGRGQGEDAAHGVGECEGHWLPHASAWCKRENVRR